MANKELSKWQDNPRIVASICAWKWKEGLTYGSILDKLQQWGIVTTENSIEGVLKNWGLTGKIVNNGAPIKSFEEICKTINEKLGITDKNIKITPPKISKSSGTITLVTSDFHTPMHREDMVTYIIKRHGKNAPQNMRVNKIIVDGDYFDTYGLSRFIRYKDIPLIEEFNTGIALCKLLCEHFPEVVFSVGNHEMRVFKYFANQGVGIDKMFLVNYDWVAYMATLFPNITIAKNLIGNENTGIHELKHYYILGKDCAVGHFEFPGGGKHNVLKAAHTANDWADKWQLLVPELNNCKLYLQGHSHAIGKVAIKGGAKTIGETGCFCQIQEYAVQPDGKYGPSTNGWWIVTQEDGETLVNESNYILWK